MKKTTTNPAPKTGRRERWMKIGIFGAALALAVSVTPLLGSTNGDALTTDGKFCVQAVSGEGSVHGKAGYRDCGVTAPVETYAIEQRGSISVDLGDAFASRPFEMRLADSSGKTVDEMSGVLSDRGYANWNFMAEGGEIDRGSDQAAVQARVQSYTAVLVLDGKTHEGEFKPSRSVVQVYENGLSQTEMGQWQLDADGWNWSDLV